MNGISRREVLATTALVLATAAAAAPDEPAQYLDPAAPVGVRVADLLGRMTLEEKVAQLGCLWLPKLHAMGVVDDAGQFVPVVAARALPNGIGHVAHLSDYPSATPPGTPPKPIADTVALANAIQAHARSTRLGIPVLVQEEATHGVYGSVGTAFPSAMALACSWDPEMVEATFALAAREARARGIGIVLAPVLDVMREPRWGRADETFGEDPYLNGEIGLAAVRGLQGRTLPLGADRVGATLKHFAGHGQPEGGSNAGPVDLSERTIRDVHIRPFKRAIQDGNALAVMASYNEMGGVPNHANHWLLTRVLRDEIGFEGFVMSDYAGVALLRNEKHVVADLPSAAALALSAGVDVETPEFESYPGLVEAVRAGRVGMDAVDRATARVLRVKFLAGLFEEGPKDARAAEALTELPAARTLARRAAERSVVLLKNDGTLPLDRTRARLAVVGPLANTVFLGGYAGVPRGTVSVLDGLIAKAGAAAIVHAPGARITSASPEVATVDGVSFEVPAPSDPAEDQRLTAEAVALARGSDAIVLCVGDSENTTGESWNPKLRLDRSELGLVGGQVALFQALRALGIPMVVLVFSGRPLALTDVADAGALLQCFALGQETGTAIADLVFGDAVPGGKLCVSLPRSVGQLPVFYGHKPGARAGYLFGSAEPLFAFGHGLSYTRFDIGEPRLAQSTIDRGSSATVTVDVRNVGARQGDEVVQLYLRDVVSSVTRPVQELVAFERVSLAPGEGRTVRFAISPDQLAVTRTDMTRVVEPGEFEIMAGSNSIETRSAILMVV